MHIVRVYMIWLILSSLFMLTNGQAFAGHQAENPGEAQLMQLAEQVSAMSPFEDSIRRYAEMLVAMASDQNSPEYEAEAHYLLGKHHYLNMRDAESIFHYRSAIALYKELGNDEKTGLATERLGMAFLQSNLPDSALTCFQKVLDIYHGKNLDARMWSPLLNISSVHERLGHTAEAFRYARKAEELSRNSADRSTRVLTITRLMGLAKDMDSLEVYTQYADAFYRLYTPLEINNDLIRHVGQYDAIQELPERIQAIQTSIKHLSEWPVTLELISSYHQLGGAYAESGQWEQAIESWRTGLQQGAGEQYLHFRPVLLRDLIHGYEQTGKFAEALQTYHQYTALRDSLNEAYSRAKIEELQIQYETRNKDNQILSQSLSLAKRTQQRNMMLIILGALIAGGMYILYAQRRYLHAQKTIASQQQALHENEIRELKKEHALQTMQTLISAQEEERTRIAKDLHDSIGASLASLRMHLREAEQTRSFNGTLKLLDNISAEVRRISHNMMPQALIQMGLPAALDDLANAVQLSEDLHVSFQNIDYDEPLTQDKEIMLYRIAQELCTNTLKHSTAKHLIIQLSRHNGSATLVIEDDGCGFDLSVQQSHGIGLQNIRSRVDYLGGEMEMITGPGEGTSVTIQIPAI